MTKIHALPGLVLAIGLTAGPLAAAAWADDPAYTTPSPTCAVPGGGTAPAGSPSCTAVKGITITNTPVVGTGGAAAGATAPTAPTSPTASTGSLPFTGAEIGLLSTVAAGAIGTGALLVAASRRRRDA